MIKLLSNDGTDNSIANTARVSMGVNENWHELPEGYDDVKRDKLLKYLATHGHSSCFRHTSVSLKCKSPLSIVRQLEKHQVGMSRNETSRRYTVEDVEIYQPNNWRTAPTNGIKQGSGGVHCNSDHWKQRYLEVTNNCVTTYNEMIDDGIAPEMARFVLPQGMMVNFVWTGSLLAFAHVYNLRSDTHAQKESQDFATELGHIMADLFPVSWGLLTNYDAELIAADKAIFEAPDQLGEV